MLALSTLVTRRRAKRKATSRDPLDLLARCRRRCRRRVPSVAAALAEVDAAGELAHHEQVGALDPLALAAGWRRAARALGRTGRRLANSPSPLRRPSSPCSGRGASGSVVSHFGPPTAAEQHGVGGAAGVEHLVGERGAVRVDRGAAHEVLLDLEVAERGRAARARRP